MKKNLKNFGLLVMIVVMLLGSLGGCCCICPTCPQETHPGSVEKISYCLLLEWFRQFTSNALRWFMLDWYSLVSKADIEWGLSQIGPWECCMSVDDITNAIRSLDGYANVPVGYAEYSNGTRVNVIICKEEGKKKVFLLVNGELEELTSDDPLIINVVI